MKNVTIQWTCARGTAVVIGALLAGVAGCKFPVPADVAVLGGEVHGLWTGASITLRLTAGDVTEDVTADATEPFTFASGLSDGASYLVAVVDDGPDHDCVVTNGSGRIAGGDVLDLAVQCTNLIPHAITISTPVPFTFDPRVTRYELPVSILQQGVEVVVTGATLTGVTVADQPVAVGDASPTVTLGQGPTTVPVVVSKGALSQRYELVIDRGAAPIVEAIFAQASNAGSGDSFGAGVAAWGEWVAIGAFGEDSSTSAAADEGAADSGAVYIFRRIGTTWTPTQILKGTAITVQRYLGFDVAMDRGVIVAGAPYDRARGDGAGAIYVFRLDEASGTWREEQRITATDAHAGDSFGQAVAIDGDRIVVGATGHDRGGTNTNYGQAYVFGRIGATWSEEAIVRDPVSAMSAGFGASVELDGDTLVARDYRSNIRVYRRSGQIWTAEMVPPQCIGPHFDLDGDVLAVGQPTDASGNGQPGDQSAPLSGAVRVFERSGAIWSEVAYLKAASPQRDAEVGRGVAVLGDSIATTAAGLGALQAFHKLRGSWIAATPVMTSRPPGGVGSFGFNMALTPQGAVLGDLAGGGDDRGAAIIFR